MVDEAEFTLFHRPYISAILTKEAIGLEMIYTLAKNFEHEQNILNWGVESRVGGGGTVLKNTLTDLCNLQKGPTKY